MWWRRFARGGRCNAQRAPASRRAARCGCNRPTLGFAAMRVLLQRVASAEVRVDERVIGRIDRGFVLLVGFTHSDGDDQLVWMADKIVGLRVFPDEDDKMNRSIGDIG